MYPPKHVCQAYTGTDTNSPEIMIHDARFKITGKHIPVLHAKYGMLNFVAIYKIPLHQDIGTLKFLFKSRFEEIWRGQNWHRTSEDQKTRLLRNSITQMYIQMTEMDTGEKR